MTAEEVSKTIKQRRKETGITQAQLAQMCGVSTYYIILVESGRKSPTLRNLEKICTALNLELLLQPQS